MRKSKNPSPASSAGRIERIVLNPSLGSAQLALPKSAEGIRVFYAEVTPEAAEKFLAEQNKNRRLNKTEVATLAKMMKDGEWRPDTANSAVAFDRSGRMIDGQHRMAAVAACGKPVDMLFMVGADAAHCDTGRRRSSRDVLDIRGCDEVFAGHHGAGSYLAYVNNVMNLLETDDAGRKYHTSAPASTRAKVSEGKDRTYDDIERFIKENAASLTEAMDEFGSFLYSGANASRMFVYKDRNSECQYDAYAWYLRNVCGYSWETIKSFFKQLTANNGKSVRNSIIDKARKIMKKDAERTANGGRANSIFYNDYLIRRTWNGWATGNPQEVAHLRDAMMFDVGRRGTTPRTIRREIEFEDFYTRSEATAKAAFRGAGDSKKKSKNG